MNKKLHFFMLVSVVFAQADKLDSLRNFPTLLQPKLFFASTDNWIPPTLPNESGCIGVGCCLLPIAGCLIGREAFKKEALPESLQPVARPKFSIGMSYSLGIACTGGALVGPRVSGIGIAPPENILAEFYLNNRLEIGAQYHLNAHWALEIHGGYMWVRLNDRNPWFYPRDTLENEAKSLRTAFWEISAFSGSIGLSYHFVNGKRMGYIGGGLEYNIAEALSHGEWVIYYPADYSPSDTIEYDGNAFRWGRGFGSFVNIGCGRQITKNISFNVTLAVRYSVAKEYKWELPSWAVLDKPINYSFTGTYLKIGFAYILFKQQTKREEK